MFKNLMAIAAARSLKMAARQVSAPAAVAKSYTRPARAVVLALAVITLTSTFSVAHQGPGFWKNWLDLFDQEVGIIGLDQDDLYESVIGVDLFQNKMIPDPNNLTLGNALGAQGGGQSALVRHSTAALVNAASDDLDYSYGSHPPEPWFPYLPPGEDRDIMVLIDVNGDTFISSDEVINAVQDVFQDDPSLLFGTDFFDFADVKDVARAFDAMNQLIDLPVDHFIP